MDPPQEELQLSAWTLGTRRLGFWKYYLSTMSPERLEQQRQYDRERSRKYREEHREEMKVKAKEQYAREKERLSEKHVCEVCGGTYTTHHKRHHFSTKKHQRATAHLVIS
jgi:hypothetical protein